MKLALFTHLPWPENVSQKDVFQGAVEQVQVAESSGYHSAWFAEHHFTRYSMGASLGVILGHMAAATQKSELPEPDSAAQPKTLEQLSQDTKHALELVSRYKKLCSDSARPSNMSEVPFFRYVHVSETEERAIEATKQHIEWIQDIMQWRRFLMDSTEVDKSILDWRRERSELPPSYEYIRENRAFIGTPEQVAEKILYLKSEGIFVLFCPFYGIFDTGYAKSA